MTDPRIESWANVWADIRRAFLDFLAVPALMVLGFVVLAIASYQLDRNTIGWLEPTRAFLKHRVITDPDTTNTLLGTIAGAMITVTSITFSLLLLAVQQSAAALTNQVLDQFLHRRLNQVYFGVFVGVSLFSLLTLATNNTSVTPVFGSTIELVLTLVALTVLLLLLYTTLNQMRSDRIIEAIHNHTLSARINQRRMLARTRREPQLLTTPVSSTVRARASGYLVGLDLDAIGAAIEAIGGTAEVVFLVALGDYVCLGDPLAEVRARSDADAVEVADAALKASALERQRDFRNDPGYGIAQLATVGWTSISTAKSNPAPGLSVIHNLRDLLARWTREDSDLSEQGDESGKAVPVVFRDEVMREVIDVLESLLVVSSESLQHQCAAAILRTFASQMDRLPRAIQSRAEDALRRGLSSLGDHVLTADLDDALRDTVKALAAAGRSQAAAGVEEARVQLGESVGTLRSRGTRVKA